MSRMTMAMAKLRVAVVSVTTVVGCDSGSPTSRPESHAPVPSSPVHAGIDLSDLRELAFAQNGLCGVTAEERVRCWGAWPGNNELTTHGGRSGLMSVVSRLDAVAEIQIGSHRFADPQSYWDHLCVRSLGRTLCWGNNRFGQVGDGSRQDRILPVVIPELVTVRQLALGDNHS